MQDERESPRAAQPLHYASENTPENALTRADIATLALRIFGIYLLVTSLPILSYYVHLQVTVGPAALAEDHMWYLSQVVIGLLGLALAVFAGQLARFILPGARGRRSESFIQLHAIAIMVLGLWLLVTSGPQLVMLVIGFQPDAFDIAVATNQRVGLLEPALKTMLGAVLFLRPNGVIHFWQKMQRVQPRR